MRLLGIRTLVVCFALLALPTGVGCTLVSGWSDLQGGTLASADAGAGQDGSLAPASRDAEPASSANDASLRGDSSPDGSAGSAADASAHDSSVDLTILCGSTRCALGEDCCAGVLSSATCQPPSASCQAPGTLESCSDSSQCTALLGHAASCCTGEQGAGLVVSCLTACVSSGQGTGSIVCDPTLAVPSCPSGMTCQPSEGFDYSTCQ